MLRPITLSAQCRPGQAGISRFAVTDANNIESIDFDTDQQIEAITMGAGLVWTEYEFDQDGVAFFNQTLSAPRGSVNWQQQISLNFPKNDIELWLALFDLNKYCNLVGAVLDNQGKMKFPGIEWLSGDVDASYKKLGLKTAEGSWNSGADPTSDSHEATIVMQCNSGKPAHFAASTFLFDDLPFTV